MTEDVGSLALYGSLMPGGENHWVVRSIDGDWLEGVALGFQFDITWGPAEGYEGFMADESGNAVPVMVLVSDRLEKNWRSVDDFHGDGFVRELVPVSLSDARLIQAWMYVARTDS